MYVHGIKMGQFITDIGGKRFVMTMGAGIVNTLLLIFKHITPTDYVTLTLGIVGVFVAANTTQNVMEKKPDA